MGTVFHCVGIENAVSRPCECLQILSTDPDSTAANDP